MDKKVLNVSLTAKVLGWGEITTEMNILPILVTTRRVHYSLQVEYHNTYLYDILILNRTERKNTQMCPSGRIIVPWIEKGDKVYKKAYLDEVNI